ncbi:MAG: phosphatidate cytidylyltransferase [Actinobacteria bacterium]|nr:MAG: phosphatidate cytidylyltransferase [Actinomycetota bacterium]
MTPMASRLLVGAIGLPVVLGIVYLGGWWMFTLVAIAAVLALHEYALVIRSLRPLVLAAYAGAILALLGARLGGIDWTVAGFLATLPFAFVLHWIATTRQSATVAIASTVLGAAWVGLGLAHLLLIREIPNNGRLAAFTVLLAVWAGDTAAFFAGRLLGRHKLAPTLSPGKTWEGFVAGTVATVFVAFVALYKQDYVSIGESIALGAVIAVAAPLGDLFESAVKRDMQVKDSGRRTAVRGGCVVLRAARVRRDLKPLAVADLRHLDPEDLDRAGRAVDLPPGRLVEVARARVVVEHPEDDVEVTEPAEAFFAGDDQLASGARSPVVGMDVDREELAVGVVVTARADTDEPDDLPVGLGHERRRFAPHLGPSLDGEPGKLFGGEDVRVRRLPGAHVDAGDVVRISGCSGSDQAANLHLRR